MKDNNILQIEIKETNSNIRYYSIIESLLFVSGEPMKLKDIASILELSPAFTKKVLKEMMFIYEDRGVKLIRINDEFQLVTKSENSEYIQKILKTNSRQSLSQASLETLAIIAYKQPITRIDIDEIRGVKSDSAVAKLLDKKLIKESGRLDAPGRPILYSTTDDFLKQLNIENIKELPSLEVIVEKYMKEYQENTEEITH
ncbi:segregation/condensation protein B [Clostridium sp. 19966]|uniref:SMC-Scp complex subunit ScpB n=1 Tax=Clostridium sp. 19966 TaxID=2768166 RepID=UPI0028DD6831|nr:SMC-Scp complex subunit ScpB [Clostridium sp. 19966]MDT8716564.1 segregation/condensation protein B [Clostridium sp. 19966]